MTVDNHSPWDNLNPSSIFFLCGSLEKLNKKSHPTDSEIKILFERAKRFIPIIKYKCINSDKWKTNSFVNANADINNDYHYVSRILHDQLFDSDVKIQDNEKKDNNNHNQNGDNKEETEENYLYYKIFIKDKQNNDKMLLIKSDVLKDTFNVNTNEELSRNMICPSVFLNSGHVLGARKWIPESDLYGTVMIKCHSTILISKNSYISANGAGYTSHFGKGHGVYYKEAHIRNQGNKYYSGGGYGTKGRDGHPSNAVGGSQYGEKTLNNTLYFGSPSGGRERGGGIIQLIAENVINYGKICCDGDSGQQFGGGSGGS